MKKYFKDILPFLSRIGGCDMSKSKKCSHEWIRRPKYITDKKGRIIRLEYYWECKKCGIKTDKNPWKK